MSAGGFMQIVRTSTSDGVPQDILSEITTTPTPNPSPQGGGEHTECLATAAIYCIAIACPGRAQRDPGPRGHTRQRIL